MASKLWKFKIFNLTSKVKFDPQGQSSLKSKFTYLNRKFCRKEFFSICIIASELKKFEISFWPPNSKIEMSICLGLQINLTYQIWVRSGYS